MRGPEAAKNRVESRLTELFETIDEDIDHGVYTEADADAAVSSALGGQAEDDWNDWKENDSERDREAGA